MSVDFRRFIGVAGALMGLCAGMSACAGKPESMKVVESRAVDADDPRADSDPSFTDTMRKSAGDVGDGFGEAISAPLVDLNLKRKEIPTVLIRAVKNTYDLTGMTSCEAIAAEVGRLDEVLGADFDAPILADTRSRTERGGKVASDYTLGAVRSAATDVIPFRGLVRKMTGAEKHHKAMERALDAGHVRRAYLKGVGMNRNCAPPAAPAGFIPSTRLPEPPATNTVRSTSGNPAPKSSAKPSPTKKLAINPSE